MSKIFNNYAFIYDRFMKAFDLDNNKYIINILKNEKGKYICDVGGGTGILGDELERQGNYVTILDPCTKMTDIARKRNKNLLIKSDIILNYHGSEVFDYIILRDSLHHIFEQEKTLKKCAELLKLNGKIIIQEFSPESKKGKLIFLFERFCREKVKPVYKSYLLKTASNLGISGKIIVVNKRDYIFIGEKKCLN